ncbi:hypothetical protein SKAU_G00153780 [Synaphobranchus kaupii]|uniref:Uncharacterized protein n=1 Tax=Synaphobranchus kaupii TaxID=118154 RepID=A0A9Q1FH50_SYNKA|nr:hypothetical protein SKAU_G00153780 [Synaphobranchus kaupii]
MRRFAARRRAHAALGTGEGFCSKSHSCDELQPGTSLIWINPEDNRRMEPSDWTAPDDHTHLGAGRPAAPWERSHKVWRGAVSTTNRSRETAAGKALEGRTPRSGAAALIDSPRRKNETLRCTATGARCSGHRGGVLLQKPQL